MRRTIRAKWDRYVDAYDAVAEASVGAHYRMHWWVRTCEGAGQPSPFIHGVVQERRTAFTWLIRLGELDWENMPLPT